MSHETEHKNGSLTFKWITGILVTIILAMAGYWGVTVEKNFDRLIDAHEETRRQLTQIQIEMRAIKIQVTIAHGNPDR
jgi:hypothetical protein